MGQTTIESLEPRRLFAASPELIFLPPRLQSVRAGVDATFSLGRLKAIGAVGPFMVQVNWNDGSLDGEVIANGLGLLPRQPQAFEAPGVQVVDVSVSDSQGLTASGVFKIRVLPASGGIVGTVFGGITGSRRRSPLGGYTFYLDLKRDGQMDAGDPTAVSNIQGGYRFSGLLPGVYRVEELVGSATQVSSPVARYEDIVVTRHVARAVPFMDLVPATQATRITLTTVATLNQPDGGGNDVSRMQVDAEGDIYVASDGGGVPSAEAHGGPAGTLFRIPAGSRNLQVPAGLTWFEDDILRDSTYMELDASGHLYIGSFTDFAGNPTAFTDRIDANDGTSGSGIEFDQTSPPIFDPAGDAFIAEQPISYPAPSNANAVFEIPANTDNVEKIAAFNTSSPSNLTMDANGNIYGLMANYSNNFDEAGPTSVTVFEIASGSHAISALYTIPAGSGFQITDLVSDSRGDLFATTETSNSSGTVIELPAGASTITQLGSFDAVPSPDLTFDPSGNLFGEVPAGSDGKGEIFEVSAKTGTLSGIFSFEGVDGDNPDGLIIDSTGNLFGITSGGGKFGGGTAFEISADTLQLTTLVNFRGAGGSNPTIGLYADSNGNLYGATDSGGKYGDGSIFKISGAGFVATTRPGESLSGKVTAGKTPLVDVTISITGKNGLDKQSTTADVNGDYSFNGLVDGQYTVQMDTPAGYERETPDSGAYDVTVKGANIAGENFSLVEGALTTIAHFDGSDGSSPGDMIMDSAGNLFGVAASGGPDNDGTVFELPAGSGTIRTIASFDGTDGSDPTGTLYIDPSGNIFGTTMDGGANQSGTVFEIPASENTIVTLHSFSYTDGLYPTSGIVADAEGNLYGTTSSYIDHGFYATPAGTFFEITAGSHAFITLVAQVGFPPTGTLVIDSRGNLFSSQSDGDLIELPAGATSIKTIAEGGGSTSTTGIVKDSAGNFYVGTDGGGLLEIPAGANNATAYGPADNAENYPITTGVPAVDADGDVFGIAGDTFGDGSVFEIVAGSGTASTIFSSSVISSANADGNLIADSHGNLFGTTTVGGGKGSIFEITGVGFVTKG